MIDQTPRLQRWARLVSTLATDADGFVYVNNHFAGHGPETIRQLQSLNGGAPWQGVGRANGAA